MSSEQAPAAPAPSAGKRVAIAFFSLTGNTRHAAQRIRAQFLQHPDRVSAVDLLDVTGPTQPPPDSFANADIIGIGSMAWGFREPTMLREWLSRVPIGHVVGKPVFVFGTNGGNEGKSISNVCDLLKSKGAILVTAQEFKAPGNFTCWMPKDKAPVWEKKDRTVIDTFAETAFALSTAQPPVSVKYSGTLLGYLGWLCTDERVKSPVGTIVVDQSLCISCGLCARICPRGAITMRDIEDAAPAAASAPAAPDAAATTEKRGRAIPIVNSAACVGCCRCINHCPKNALNSSSTKGRVQYVFREDP